MNLITEQTTKIKATLPKGDPNKKQEVFYNPLMKSNRNISTLLINSIKNKKMNFVFPLAGSGIRALRFLKELKRGKISTIHVNDLKENFPTTFKENLKLNNLNTNKVLIHNQDAELLLLTQHQGGFGVYFDYIDLDPFGTPNPFLASAVNKIKRNGILAITATDTAALTGTYPKVTKRKYWATSLKNYIMHETGLRILIRKVQLQGIQFDKALIPILAYHKDHYFRLYFLSEKGKEKCDQLLKQHQYFLFNPKTLEFKTSNYNQESEFQFAGPLWTGKLINKPLITKMVKNNPFPEEQKFLETLKEESKIDITGFYDLHVLSKKLKQDPKKRDILKKIKASPTHFSPTGFKTKKSIKEIIKILK
ncbi:hypothetical protein HOC13_04355 [Candidatus Woesearchaeota archaeon]|nr:hypothetical protein [Candidatus Woesearchaeota archaeon]